MWNHKIHKFWFCVNDIHRCVEGAIQTFVFKHPSLPNVWLVMSNTNFTRMKLWVLKKQVFIYQNIRSHLKDFLGSWNLLEVMINNQEPPFKIGKAPSKYDQKSFQWSEPNKLDDYKWESTNLMDVSILHHIDLPPLEIEHVYTISIFGSMLHGYVCDVTMRCYLACSCFDFISMLSFSIGRKNMFYANTYTLSLLKGCLVTQRLIFSFTNSHWVGVKFIVCCCKITYVLNIDMWWIIFMEKLCQMKSLI